MKIWTNNRFSGFWPVPTAAVAVAATPEEAAAMLNDELEHAGLARNAQAADFVEMPTADKAIRVLSFGDY